MSFNVDTLVVGPIQTNCYFLSNQNKDTIIIDPGEDFELIKKHVAEHKLVPVAIINTHGHYDHLFANKEVKEHYKIPSYFPLADKELIKVQTELYGVPSFEIDNYFDDQDKIKIAGIELDVISTPGHSAGSSCLKLGQILFTGDTMFANGDYGRTDLWSGSDQDIRESLVKLLKYPDDIIVYPGHGPSSTIGDERKFYET